MTPTSFDFTVTLPCDARLLGAVRQLAAQAAGYAQLTADAGEGLAHQVERAAALALEGPAVDASPVELRFWGEPDAVGVYIVCAWQVARPADAVTIEGLSVVWHVEGTRHTCHISQRVPA